MSSVLIEENEFQREEHEQLRAQISQAHERLTGLERDLQNVDNEFESLGEQRERYQLLEQVCTTLERLDELGDRTSRLGPLWYMGSFLIGAAAGLAGDRWSLGFVVETERQVVRHLDGHLAALPGDDARSRAILAQMREDENVHATRALESGAAELPGPVKRLMSMTARVMTETAYRL